MSQRGFPPPWTVKQAGDASFIVCDANGQKLAYVYYEEKPGQQSVQSLTKDDGRRIAVNFARLPELLRAQPHWR
jgi:endo-1,4-beta-D-glucanase Y